MIIRTDTQGTGEALHHLLQEMAADPSVGLILVLACEANAFTPARLNPVLTQCPKPLIGGIFPQIITNGIHLARGTVVAGMPCHAQTVTLPHLSCANRHMEDCLAKCLPTHAPANGLMWVLVDSQTSQIEPMVEALFNMYGLEIDYLGAAAGSLLFSPVPCIISNQGLLSDAAVLALTDIHAGVGVAHGWEPVSESFKVTGAEKNKIVTLDLQPAFQVYRDIVEAHSAKLFSSHRFFDLSMAYPFGLARMDSEMVVREAFDKEEDAIICGGEISENTYVQVLHGRPDNLIAAARLAKLRSIEAFGVAQTGKTAFCANCVSRGRSLENRFEEEMQALQIQNIPMIGALSLGEIANSGRDYLEFFNKTSVVGLLNV